LNLVRADNFNELVNMAITQEDCISAHRAEKKRKAERTNTRPRGGVNRPCSNFPENLGRKSSGAG
jgi:hypothetical protein